MPFFFLSFLLCAVSHVASSNDQCDSDTLPPIRLLGDPILETPAREVTLSEILTSEVIKEAIRVGHASLSDFRAKNGFGRGIAAPQFGYSIQMICLNLDGQMMTLFNPVIFHHSEDTFLMWDDCFSFPNLMVSVQRYKSISVRFFDELGSEQILNNLSQEISELLQHEIDHLRGVLAVNIAVRPVNGDCASRNCPSIVPRDYWLRHRDQHESYL
jgi:peptide deformylase